MLNVLYFSVLNLTITYSPISLFKWQMYAAQGMRNKWYGMLGSDFMEESDEDQDSLKVEIVNLRDKSHKIFIFLWLWIRII